MSRRRTSGSSFQLDTVATTPLSIATPTRRAGVSTALPNCSGLTFKFNEGCASPTSGPTAPATAAAPLRSAMSSVFSAFVAPTTAPAPEPPAPPATAVHTPDVMRLAAGVEDLRTRLRQSTEKTTHYELQIKQLRAQLQRERLDAQQHYTQTRQQLDEARVAEKKAQKELMARPMMNELKPNEFENSVVAALVADEQLATVKKELDELHSKRDELKTELAALEVACCASKDAVGETSCKTDCTDEKMEVCDVQNVKDVDDVDPKGADATTAMQTEVDALSARLSALKDDVLRHEAQRDAYVEDAKAAEAELAAVSARLVENVNDVAAVKEQHAEAKLLLDETTEKVAQANEQIAAAELREQAVENKMAELNEKKAAVDAHVEQHAPLRVTGALWPGATAPSAPKPTIDFSFGAWPSRTAPLSHHTHESIATAAADSESAMVNAVVADIKSFFESRVQERETMMAAAIGVGA